MELDDLSEPEKFILATDRQAEVNDLETLANHERQSKSFKMRSEIAKNPACPTYLLEEFSKDKHLKSSVAENPVCPVLLLESLAKDKSKLVREAAWKVVAGKTVQRKNN